MSILTKIQKRRRADRSEPAVDSPKAHAEERASVLAHLKASPTLEVVTRGLRAMVAAYAATLRTQYNIDIGNEENFVADVMLFIPIAAALNLCSNVLHAVSGLLAKVARDTLSSFVLRLRSTLADVTAVVLVLTIHNVQYVLYAM